MLRCTYIAVLWWSRAVLLQLSRAVARRVERKLTMHNAKYVIQVSSDTILKSEFQELSVDSCWIPVKSEYPEIISKPLAILLPFYTLYLCEVAFSTLKTKNRSTLRDVLREMRASESVCLSSAY